MVGSSTSASNMRHEATHGYRFTHDVKDLNGNVNATGRFITQLPSPYYDRDPGGTSGRSNEGEITSESSSFPTANQSYASFIEFSHWYQTVGSSGVQWIWDSGGGSVTQTAQISGPGCPIVCDKWDAVVGLLDKEMGPTTYPSQSPPSSSSAVEFSGEDAASPRAKPSAARQVYGVRDGASKGEVVLTADFTNGLEAYRVAANTAADQIIDGGRARGIVTFSRPVSVAVVKELRAMGVSIESVEAVTTANKGPRWSLGGPADAALEAWLDVSVADTGEELLGIVSARVVVDFPALERVRADDRVYLVDLSLEHYARSNRMASDIVMNDVFWTLAGWSD